jgi:hypothetical protein
MKSSSRCWSWCDTTFALVVIIAIIPKEKMVHETSWISNDYVCQSVNNICCKHNIHSLLWWLERWHWKNMCLLLQNMEPDVLNNGCRKISNYIMCGRVFSLTIKRRLDITIFISLILSLLYFINYPKSLLHNI